MFIREEQAFWISIGVSCVMGLIIGILLIFLYKIGYFVIGLGLGASILAGCNDDFSYLHRYCS